MKSPKYYSSVTYAAPSSTIKIPLNVYFITFLLYFTYLCFIYRLRCYLTLSYCVEWDEDNNRLEKNAKGSCRGLIWLEGLRKMSNFVGRLIGISAKVRTSHPTRMQDTAVTAGTNLLCISFLWNFCFDGILICLTWSTNDKLWSVRRTGTSNQWTGGIFNDDDVLMLCWSILVYFFYFVTKSRRLCSLAKDLNMYIISNWKMQRGLTTERSLLLTTSYKSVVSPIATCGGLLNFRVASYGMKVIRYERQESRILCL
jgi:hypothetical protein